MGAVLTDLVKLSYWAGWSLGFSLGIIAGMITAFLLIKHFLGGKV